VEQGEIEVKRKIEIEGRGRFPPLPIGGEIGQRFRR
jgi:hypothetical protein